VVISKFLELLNQKNVAAVVRELYLEQKASRARIASATGVAPSTVTSIVDKLARLNVVESTEELSDPGSVGRPGTLLTLSSDALYALGIEINVFASRVTLVGLRGTVEEEERVTVDARSAPHKALSLLAEAADKVVTRSGVERDRVMGLGVGFMGYIDSANGEVLRSTSLAGWNRIRITDIFERTLSMPVFVENNGNAMVLGEARFGAGQGRSNLLGVAVDQGMGGGIIIDRRLYTGSHGAAGEFGHMSVAEAGPICHCGNKGCLRTLACESAIEANAARIMRTGVSSLLRQKPGFDHSLFTIHEIIEAAQQGDMLCGDLIFEASRYLGMGLVNLVNALNPDMVIFNDGPLPNYEPFFGSIARMVTEGCWAGEQGVPDLRISALKANAVSVGAATVVLDRVLAGYDG
jgi:predicted NBD/HSP70 family sugar kinase